MLTLELRELLASAKEQRQEVPSAQRNDGGGMGGSAMRGKSEVKR